MRSIALLLVLFTVATAVAQDVKYVFRDLSWQRKVSPVPDVETLTITFPRIPATMVWENADRREYFIFREEGPNLQYAQVVIDCVGNNPRASAAFIVRGKFFFRDQNKMPELGIHLFENWDLVQAKVLEKAFAPFGFTSLPDLCISDFEKMPSPQPFPMAMFRRESLRKADFITPNITLKAQRSSFTLQLKRIPQ